MFYYIYLFPVFVRETEYVSYSVHVEVRAQLRRFSVPIVWVPAIEQPLFLRSDWVVHVSLKATLIYIIASKTARVT